MLHNTFFFIIELIARGQRLTNEFPSDRPAQLTRRIGIIQRTCATDPAHTLGTLARTYNNVLSAQSEPAKRSN